MKKQTLSFLVACYNEKENIAEMYSRIVNVMKKLPEYSWEMLFIDNASTDDSRPVYEAYAKKDKRVKIVYLSRNFGSPQPSFLAGMQYSSGDAVILLHGDIQDPPELVPKFVQAWEDHHDVVYGVRISRRGYSALWNFYYKAFYVLLNKLAYIAIPINAGDFSLLSRRVVEELLTIEEYDYYVRCLRAYVGFRQIGIPYIRDPRTHGRSNESFLSGLWWAKTIIVNFSFKPLEWISMMAFSVVLLTVLLFVLNIFWYMLYRNALPGLPTIVLLILFLGGVQLLSISVIAEYLAKMFLEVKKRPKYIVESTVNLQKRL